MIEGFACFKNKAIAQLEDEKEEASMDIAEMKMTICLLNRRVSKLKGYLEYDKCAEKYM